MQRGVLRVTGELLDQLLYSVATENSWQLRPQSQQGQVPLPRATVWQPMLRLLLLLILINFVRDLDTDFRSTALNSPFSVLSSPIAATQYSLERP